MDILKEIAGSEEIVEYPQEFVRGSDYCLFRAHPLESFHLVISFETMGGEDCAKGHTPSSTKMGVAPFRDPEFPFEFSREEF